MLSGNKNGKRRNALIIRRRLLLPQMICFFQLLCTDKSIYWDSLSSNRTNLPTFHAEMGWFHPKPGCSSSSPDLPSWLPETTDLPDAACKRSPSLFCFPCSLSQRLRRSGIFSFFMIRISFISVILTIPDEMHLFKRNPVFFRYGN